MKLISNKKFDIDEAINKIVDILKDDYGLYIDDEEEYALKSDMLYILTKSIR